MNDPLVREHKTRREHEGVFSYELELSFKLTSKKQRPIPGQLQPKIDTTFQQLGQEIVDTIAKIFDDYEAEPIG